VMNETAQLGEFVAGLEYSALRPDVVQTAKLCILDTLGVGLFASQTAWTAMVGRVGIASRGADESVIWGHGVKVPAEYAALVNGVAAHGIEMDDRKPSLGLHPGCQVIPSAIALGEKVHIDGKHLISAITAGYEVVFRVGRAVPRPRRGINSAAHKGVWGSVASSCKVLRLDKKQTLSAFGIAGFMAAGISEYAEDGSTSMIKRLMGGWPSHSGVMAALLAGQGLTGPGAILEDKWGYCAIVAGDQEPRLGELTKGLGESFQILEREIKPYAAWGGSHLCIDAVNLLKDQHQVSPENIEQVTVLCASRLYENRQIRSPQSIMAGQMSMPFITSLAFFYDLRDPDIWRDEILSEPRILELLDHVECRVDDEIERRWRATGGQGEVKVVARLKNGVEKSVTVAHSKGTSENPLTDSEIREKFRLLAGRRLSPERCEKVADTVCGLEEIADICELTELVRTPR
jgi:2-methylcitrate dehydratase PrpD